MGFFKRKVKIRDYCHKKFDYIFSENGKKFMNNLIVDGGILIDETSEANYYINFIAAYFELAEIAFSRNLKRDLRYEAMEISSEYLREKNASDIESLIHIYNSAFGSSFEDGIKPMSDIIANNISEKSTSDTAKYFYGVFYGIIEAFMRDLKAIKIIA